MPGTNKSTLRHNIPFLLMSKNNLLSERIRLPVQSLS